MAGLAKPGAAKAASTGGLMFCHQQHGLCLTCARAAHQLGVGGVNLRQHFNRQTGLQGNHCQPEVFSGPDHATQCFLDLALSAFLSDFFLSDLLALASLFFGNSDVDDNKVPRHFLAPHQQGYSNLSFLVNGASMTKP